MHFRYMAIITPTLGQEPKCHDVSKINVERFIGIITIHLEFFNFWMEVEKKIF